MVEEAEGARQPALHFEAEGGSEEGVGSREEGGGKREEGESKRSSLPILIMFSGPTCAERVRIFPFI
jgi:hypothetical protein